MVAISTVPRLLLKQLGEWVASERLLKRSRMIFLTAIGKGACVFYSFICVCLLGLFVCLGLIFFFYSDDCFPEVTVESTYN